MASSKYLHCSICLSCIIWVTTELCLERAEASPGVCWARPSNSWAVYRFPQCCSHCLCLLQPCLSILTEPTEKLTAQSPTAWGNTCHAHFGKQRQGSCTRKAWMVGGREGGLGVLTSRGCNMKPSSTWALGKGWKSKRNRRKWTISAQLKAADRNRTAYLFFFFFLAMWSSPCAVLKAHFVKPAVKRLYDLLLSLLQNCTIH